MARLTEASQLFKEQPICDRVEVVRQAEGLANVAKDLVGIRGRF